MSASSGNRNVLAFGTYNVRSHPRIGILLEGLRAHGYVCEELNHPLPVGTAGRVAALSNPLEFLRFSFALGRCWARLFRDSFKYRRRLGSSNILVGYMGHFDVLLARLLFPTRQIILDHLIFAADTAQDRGNRSSIIFRLLHALDRLALRSASVIVVDTDEHRDLVPDEFRSRVVTVPVGAPLTWFDARLSDSTPDSGELSVIFYGLFTPLQGAPVIARGIAEAAAHVLMKITMVGSGQDYNSCREILGELPVQWIDWVDADALPALVAQHDVCFGIAGDTPKSLRVVPNKVFQGMAAGCCVLTSRTPPQVRLLGDGVMWCEPGDSDSIARALIALSRDHALLQNARSRAAKCADSTFAPKEIVLPLIRTLQ
ncbi:glycosyltransferase [Schaalia canis]|uniref:Glycosyltransferase n=2 Tax=Schaalia canis TaxID=100469 RepID=A0A3P1SCJ1_9ACTO|nr:glycosyltransferase [Schaalia canis]